MHRKILSSAKQRQLIILLELLQTKHTLQSLSETFDTPIRTVKSHLSNTNADLRDIFGIDHFIRASHQGEYDIDPLFEDIKILVYHDLKLYYQKKSPIFLLLVMLTTRISVSAQLMIDTIFISEEYLKKCISEINQFVEYFNIQIVYANNILMFQGDEQGLRMFCNVFLCNSYQVVSPPFGKSIVEIQALESSNDKVRGDKTVLISEHLFIETLHDITQLRVNHGYYIEDIPEDAQWIMKSAAYGADQHEQMFREEFSQIPEMHQKFEYLYYNYLKAVILSDGIPYNRKIEIGKHLAEGTHDFAVYGQKVSEILANELGGYFDEDTKALSVFFSSYFYSALRVLGRQLPYHGSFQFPDPNYLSLEEELKLSVYNFTEAFYEKVVDYAADVLDDEIQNALIFKRMTKLLLYRLIQMAINANVNIYINTSRDVTRSSYIAHQIRKVFNNKSVTFTENVEEAHLIITDTAVIPAKDVTVFILYSLKSYEEWRNLVTLIQDILLKKLYVEVEASYSYKQHSLGIDES